MFTMKGIKMNVKNLPPKTRNVKLEEKKYLSIREIADFFSISERTVWRYIAKHVFPQPIAIGPRLKRLNLSECISALHGMQDNQEDNV